MPVPREHHDLPLPVLMQPRKTITIIGNRIQPIIASLGMTEQQAADRIGISLRTLRNAINSPHLPHLKTAFQIAYGLGRTIEDLWIVKVTSRHQ